MVTKRAITLRNVKLNVEDISKITEFRKTGIRGETKYTINSTVADVLTIINHKLKRRE